MVKKAKSDFMKLMLIIIAAWVAVTILGVVLNLEIPGLLFVLSWVIPPVWVARDARKRGVENPLLWVVFVLLTWFVGLVVYLILRPQEPLIMECGGCGKEVKNEFSACPYCGHDLRPRISRCAHCKRLIDRDWSFCPYCKTELPE
jgi:RNA polymerase subunit RPABC4/transcription elongation factor Spt4